MRHLGELAVHEIDGAPECDGAQVGAIELAVEEVLDARVALLDVQELIAVVEHQVLLRLPRPVRAVVVHQRLESQKPFIVLKFVFQVGLRDLG